MIYSWLVGTFSIFPYIGNFIIPLDFPIFQRGGPTTNQIITIDQKNRRSRPPPRPGRCISTASPPHSWRPPPPALRAWHAPGLGHQRQRWQRLDGEETAGVFRWFWCENKGNCMENHIFYHEIWCFLFSLQPFQ